jgi:hypothetical protein
VRGTARGLRAGLRGPASAVTGNAARSSAANSSGSSHAAKRHLVDLAGKTVMAAGMPFSMTRRLDIPVPFARHPWVSTLLSSSKAA